MSHMDFKMALSNFSKNPFDPVERGAQVNIHLTYCIKNCLNAIESTLESTFSFRVEVNSN